MSHPNTLRACVIAGALVLSSAAGVLAQGTFEINGRLKIEGGGLDDARVVVFKNGEKQRTLTNGLGKFTLNLDLNADYILAFEKVGFVTKKLSFNTRAPAEAIANGFTPFEFAVSLFKQYEGVNTVVFNQPVGMIRYDQNVDDFDYDTDYTKSIQTALDQSMQEVTAKQDQEKNKEADDAARAEKEAKARAKAEAEKAKQEAESAKQKAKEEKAAAEAAERERKAQEVEARKAAEAAAKAEKERLAEESRKKEEPAPPPAPPVKSPEPAPPVVRKDPEPAPAMNKIAARTGTLSPPKAEEVHRRGVAPIVVQEENPVHKARAVETTEARPQPREEDAGTIRNEELIIEPNQVITRIELDNGRERTEYRKVVHKYGSVFYFKDGQSISRTIYESEALAETR